MSAIPDIMDLGDETYVLTGGNSGALVNAFSLEDGKDIIDTANATPVETITTNKDGKMEVAYWGRKNNLPAERELLVSDNGIASKLLETKRNYLLGNGKMFYKEIYVDGKRTIEECEPPAKMKEWMELNEIDDYLSHAASELILQNQITPEFVENAGGEIVSINLIEANYIRAEKQKFDTKAHKTRIQNWLICGDWKNVAKNNKIIKVPNLDRYTQQTTRKNRPTKYIIQYADKFLGGPYYWMPTYWASRVWIKLANCIPVFHLNNLNNGYTIRFHIQYPKDFFVNKLAMTQATTDELKKKVIANAAAKKQQFFKKVNEVLRGIKNAGTTIMTSYDVTKSLGKEYAGIKITPISVDLKDKALLELFDKSNEAATSSMGILPSLSGIATVGKLSSGSDIRNAHAFYLLTKVYEQRRLLYAAINRACKQNGWLTGEHENCKWGSRDLVMTTLDDNKEGVSDSTNITNQETTEE